MTNDEITILKNELIELIYNKDLVKVGKRAKRKKLNHIYYATIETYDFTEAEKYKIYKYIALTNIPYFIQMCQKNQVTESVIIKLIEETPDLLGRLPHSIITTPNIYKFILTNLDSFYYDILPEPIAQIPQVQQYYNQKVQIYKKDGLDTKGYDKEWTDKDGELVKYFELLNSYPIKSKSDYLKIVEKYKESGLSIKRFCEVYHINNVEGFKKLLDRVKAESISEENEITEVNQMNSKRYIFAIHSIVEKMISGEMTLKQYLENHFNYLHTLDKFSGLIEYSVRMKFYNVLASQLVTYIVNNENDIKIEQLEYFFCDDSVNYDISATKTCSEIIRFIMRNSSTRLDHNTMTKIRSVLNAYTPNFMRKNVSSRYGIKGQFYDVTDEKIDETIAFMKDNHIYLCMKTFDYYLKKILTGELTYSKECKENKIDLINTIIMAHNVLKEKHLDTIDNYFSTIETEKRMG